MLKIRLGENCQHVEDECEDINARCRGVGLPCLCTGSYVAVGHRCRTIIYSLLLERITFKLCPVHAVAENGEKTATVAEFHIPHSFIMFGIDAGFINTVT